MKARTIQELIELLQELISSGKIHPQDVWWGWDDGSLIIAENFATTEKAAIENGIL